jgi:hypothetical protein
VFELFGSDVHAYLRALAGDREPRVGPFVLLLDANDAGPYRNYAVPHDGAEPTPADIDVLIAAFADRERKPSWNIWPRCALGSNRHYSTPGSALRLGFRC